MRAVAEGDRSCTVTVSDSSLLHILGSPSYEDHVTHSSRCGSPLNPWIVDTQTGQKINVSILDFGRGQSLRQTDDVVKSPTLATGITVDHPMDRCATHYGYIVDKAAAGTRHRNVTICNVKDESMSAFILQSKSNTVEMVLASSSIKKSDGSASFLIAFQGNVKLRLVRL